MKTERRSCILYTCAGLCHCFLPLISHDSFKEILCENLSGYEEMLLYLEIGESWPQEEHQFVLIKYSDQCKHRKVDVKMILLLMMMTRRKRKLQL